MNIVTLYFIGNIYISTCETHSIRKVRATTGIISTVIGTTIFGYSGDGGPATSATLSCPYGFVVDSPGSHINIAIDRCFKLISV